MEVKDVYERLELEVIRFEKEEILMSGIDEGEFPDPFG